MNLPAAITLLLLSMQAALCLPPDIPVSLSAIGAEGIATRERADRLRQQGRLHDAARLLSGFAALHNDDAPGPLLAHIHNDLGALWQDQRRLPEAYRSYKKSVEEWERSGPKYRLHAATGLNNLATVLWDDGRLTDAYNALTRSAAIQIEVAGPFSPALQQLYYNQGVLGMALNRFAEAEEDYRKYLRIAHSAIDTGYLLRSALVSSDLGLLCQRAGRTAEASHRFQQSRQLWAQWRTLASGSPESKDLDPVLLVNLAASFWKAGSASEAASAVEMALAAWGPASGTPRTRLVGALQLHAKILRGMKRKAEAKAAELRVKEILLSDSAPSSAVKDRIDIAALQSVIAGRRNPRH